MVRFHFLSDKHYNVKPIKLTLQSSQHLLALLLLAGVLFGGMVYFLPLPSFWRLFVMMYVGFATAYYCWRYALLALPNAIVAIQIDSKNQLELVRKDGKRLSVQVLANTVVSSRLTVLNCQVNEATFWQKLLVKHVIILPDAVDAEHFRQLRVWLRWAKGIFYQTTALDTADENIA